MTLQCITVQKYLVPVDCTCALARNDSKLRYELLRMAVPLLVACLTMRHGLLTLFSVVMSR